MSLERAGILKAKYKKKKLNIYSEPNMNDFTIELISKYGNVITVPLSDIKICKKKGKR